MSIKFVSSQDWIEVDEEESPAQVGIDAMLILEFTCEGIE
jgi:hypothetical protein